MEKKALTVTQLNYQIKNLLEGQGLLQGFSLKGEISNFTHHRSGHLYFALKDENSQVRAIMFQGHAKSLTFSPKDGDKVTVTANISVYPPQGTYSLQVTSMQVDGAGELYLKYLELKNKLKSLGWFDKPKKTIPKFPKNIGVVTSPTGAVIQDITNTVNRRYRLTNIILYPANVQGADASKMIANQIEKANTENIVDVLIVGRGGGSLEDLWGFNELVTISAIYNSKIPIITAIGHETDDTISDLVSDLRAPTPTAAAEIATPNSFDLANQLKDYNENIKFKLTNILNKHQTSLVYLTERVEKAGPLKKLFENKDKLSNLTKFLNNYFKQIVNINNNNLNTYKLKINNLSPKNKLTNSFDKINQIKEKLGKNYYYILEKQDNNLSLLQNKLIILNPMYQMKRGFTITADTKGNIVKSVKHINKDELINVKFYDGDVDAKIINKKEYNNGK